MMKGHAVPAVATTKHIHAHLQVLMLHGMKNDKKTRKEMLQGLLGKKLTNPIIANTLCQSDVAEAADHIHLPNGHEGSIACSITAGDLVALGWATPSAGLDRELSPPNLATTAQPTSAIHSNGVSAMSGPPVGTASQAVATVGARQQQLVHAHTGMPHTPAGMATAQQQQVSHNKGSTALPAVQTAAVPMVAAVPAALAGTHVNTNMPAPVQQSGITEVLSVIGSSHNRKEPRQSQLAAGHSSLAVMPPITTNLAAAPAVAPAAAPALAPAPAWLKTGNKLPRVDANKPELQLAPSRLPSASTAAAAAATGPIPPHRAGAVNLLSHHGSSVVAQLLSQQARAKQQQQYCLVGSALQAAHVDVAGATAGMDPYAIMADESSDETRPSDDGAVATEHGPEASSSMRLQPTVAQIHAMQQEHMPELTAAASSQALQHQQEHQYQQAEVAAVMTAPLLQQQDQVQGKHPAIDGAEPQQKVNEKCSCLASQMQPCAISLLKGYQHTYLTAAQSLALASLLSVIS